MSLRCVAWWGWREVDTEIATQPLPIHHLRKFPLASLCTRSSLALKNKPFIFQELFGELCEGRYTHAVEHPWRSEDNLESVSFFHSEAATLLSKLAPASLPTAHSTAGSTVLIGVPTTVSDLFFFFMWVPEIGLGSSGLQSKCSCLQSYLPNPIILILFLAWGLNSGPSLC